MSEEILGELQRAVGRIEGKIDGVGSKLESIDGRLREVESRSVLSGAVSGGVMAVGIAVLKQKLGL